MELFSLFVLSGIMHFASGEKPGSMRVPIAPGLVVSFTPDSVRIYPAPHFWLSPTGALCDCGGRAWILNNPFVCSNVLNGGQDGKPREIDIVIEDEINTTVLTVVCAIASMKAHALRADNQLRFGRPNAIVSVRVRSYDQFLRIREHFKPGLPDK